jgi:hypothetical protein
MQISLNNHFDKSKSTKDLLLSFILDDCLNNEKVTKLITSSLNCPKSNDLYDKYMKQKNSTCKSGKTIVTILKKPTVRNKDRFKTVKEAKNGYKIINKIINKELLSNKKLEYFKRKVIDTMYKEELYKSYAKESLYSIESIVENINNNKTFLDKKTLLRIEEGYSTLKKLAESFKVLYKEEGCILDLKKLLTFKDIPQEETLEFDSSRSSKTSKLA